MERKYEFTNETRQILGRTLHRIVALRDFGNVKAGDKGGWIEKESNLSHEGNCWVYDDAEVYEDARVYDDAILLSKAAVSDKASVCDKALVGGNAQVYGCAAVFGRAEVSGNAEVHNEAMVCGSAKVSGDAQVYEYAKVYSNAEVYDNAEVYGSAEVCGNAEVGGRAILRGDAVVSSKRDYIVFKNWWSSGRYFTWTRSNNLWRVGCFLGTGDELIRKAYEDSKQSGREYKRIVRYVMEIQQAEAIKALQLERNDNN